MVFTAGFFVSCGMDGELLNMVFLGEGVVVFLCGLELHSVWIDVYFRCNGFRVVLKQYGVFYDE